MCDPLSFSESFFIFIILLYHFIKTDACHNYYFISSILPFFLPSFNKNQKIILICRNKNVKFSQTMILSVVLRVYLLKKSGGVKMRIQNRFKRRLLAEITSMPNFEHPRLTYKNPAISRLTQIIDDYS